jgi:mannitol-1-phosphate/altronate dehydrogenase
MPRALIYGAGALGRGFVAPLLAAHGYAVSFVDVDPTLVARLRARGRYRAATAGRDGYRFADVPVTAAYLLGEEDDVVADQDLVVSCVGARSCLGLWRKLGRARAVVTCENESDSAEKLRALSGNPRVYFGIPDVITSSTAPPELLAADPLTVVTEEGVLIVEHGEHGLPATIRQLDAAGVREQWACKLYLHNSPHCLTAYLGSRRGCTWMHEAMARPEIDAIAVGAMEELKAGVTFAGLVRPALAASYAEKELRRFRNPRLYDPIARVAREPLRKLGRGERLTGAAQLALYAGVRPVNLCRGIQAALDYHDPADPDLALSILRRALGAGEVLRMVADLGEHDPLARMVLAEG